MTRLIAQHESPVDEQNRSHGLEVLHDDAEGFYTTRFHIRTYDGIKVTDSWSTGEVRLNSITPTGAWAEAKRVLDEFWAMINNVAL